MTDLKLTSVNNGLPTPDAIREFVLAGNAKFTLHSQKTGAHYTYQVKQAVDKQTEQPIKGLWFVTLLTGPNNEGDFTYLGVFRTEATSQRVSFALTKKSRLSPDAASVKALQYVWKWAYERDIYPPDTLVFHEGKCGRCGRTLTVPESLERGIGPECAGKMGLKIPDADCPEINSDAVSRDEDNVYGCEISSLQLTDAPLAFCYDGRKFMLDHCDRGEGEEILGWWYKSDDDRAFFLSND